MKQTNTKPKPYDAVIVLGKNWKQYPPDTVPVNTFKLELSIDSQIQAWAAGHMYEEGLVKKIIFSTGKTAGKHFPSEAKAMAEFMYKKFPNIPKQNVILEEKSFDTATNAQEILQIIKKRRFKKIALLATHTHMPRAHTLFKNFGIKTHDFYAEDEVKKISHNYKKFIDTYMQSPHFRIENMKEFLLRQFMIFDPKGKFLENLTRRIRHQEITARTAAASISQPVFVVFLETK